MTIPPPPSGSVPYDKELAISLLTDMLRIRRLEEKAAELYGATKIRGFLHLYVGEEAVATGAIRALGGGDSVVATYREHGHALLRGTSMRSIMAEMYGKHSGCAHGRGGSMHLFDRSTRFFGGQAIVAGGLPLAVGLALAIQMQGKSDIVACFFGDGAVAEGAFHESMNLAALWRLPVLFCCENNLYAMGTALERSEYQPDLCAKAASYRMEATRVDGMDVVAVYEAARAAVQAVRSGTGPLFVEFQTYRFRAHSMFDPELYRSRLEVDAWKARGPLHTYTARLKLEGKLSEDEFLALDAEVEREVADAIAFAEQSEFESVATLTQDLYSPTLEAR